MRHFGYLFKVKNDAEGKALIKALKTHLSHGYRLHLRGRHSQRKATLKAHGLTPNGCGDIPWDISDTIAVYVREPKKCGGRIYDKG